MKKLLFVVGLVTIALGGCYVVPYGDHDEGYRRDRERGDDAGHNRDHRERDRGRGGERSDRDGYR